MRMYGWVFGLAIAAGYVVGCNNQQSATPYAEAEKAPEDDHGHEHHHEGPKGGHVVELGDDHAVHGEFLIDAEAKLARFYLYGEDLKTPVEATEVTLHAEGESGDEVEITLAPVGDGPAASEFTVAVEQLPSSDIEQLFGHFHVKVGDKEIHGDLAHDHDHEHEHEHEHEEAAK